MGKLTVTMGYYLPGQDIIENFGWNSASWITDISRSQSNGWVRTRTLLTWTKPTARQIRRFKRDRTAAAMGSILWVGE